MTDNDHNISRGSKAEDLPGRSLESELPDMFRVVAHMAASFQNDPKYFNRLERLSRRSGSAMEAVREDTMGTPAHERTVKKLRQRLVNYELKARALADAAANGRPVYDLTNSAVREANSFLCDFNEAKQAAPDRADSFERLYGGYALQMTGGIYDKGGELLARYETEKQAALDDAARARQEIEQRRQAQLQPDVRVLRPEE